MNRSTKVSKLAILPRGKPNSRETAHKLTILLELAKFYWTADEIAEMVDGIVTENLERISKGKVYVLTDRAA
jgi:hypothetical protein